MARCLYTLRLLGNEGLHCFRWVAVGNPTYEVTVCRPQRGQDGISLVPKRRLGMPVGQAPLDNTLQLSSPHILK